MSIAAVDSLISLQPMMRRLVAFMTRKGLPVLRS